MQQLHISLVYQIILGLVLSFDLFVFLYKIFKESVCEFLCVISIITSKRLYFWCICLSVYFGNNTTSNEFTEFFIQVKPGKGKK